MTEQEAIKELNSFHAFELSSNCRDLAKEALEKQIPQKVIDVTDYWGEDELEYSEKGCPKCNYHDCGLESSNDVEFNYCPMCGQRLDWE